MEKNTDEGVPAPEKSYDEKKLEALYRQFRPFAKYTAMAKNRDDLGEDLVQEFVVIWLYIQAKDGHPFHSLEPHEQIFYLKAVIRYRLSAMLKKESRFIYDYDDEVEAIPDEANEPYQVQVTLLERNIKRRLKEFAEEILTEREFDIFEARLRGCSYKEIAEAMNQDESINRDKSINRHEKVCRKAMSRAIIPKMSQAFIEKGFI